MFFGSPEHLTFLRYEVLSPQRRIYVLCYTTIHIRSYEMINLLVRCNRKLVNYHYPTKDVGNGSYIKARDLTFYRLCLVWNFDIAFHSAISFLVVIAIYLHTDILSSSSSYIFSLKLHLTFMLTFENSTFPFIAFRYITTFFSLTFFNQTPPSNSLTFIIDFHTSSASHSFYGPNIQLH